MSEAALKIDGKTTREWMELAQKGKKQLHSVKEKTAEIVGEMVTKVEVFGSSFAMGVIQGRFGGVEVVGAPVDLVAAGGLGLLGFALPQREYASHLHALSNGCLGSYGSTIGRGVGK